MLDMNSRGDGYPGNWVRYCDTCKAETSTLYCHTDSAYLCNSCDERYHAASSMALPHECVWIFTAYENATAAFTSRDDAASFCVSCDADIHLANPLAHRHVQIPETPFSGLCYAASSTYQKELPDIMLHTENEIAAPTTLEAYEDETEYWLLLEPDKYDIQTNIGFTYSEELNESFGKLEYNSRTESRCQDQKNQGQLYCGHQVDNGSDGDKYDIQTNIGFTYGKELNESFGKLEYNSRTESRCQDQKNQGQLYCGHQVDNGSDGIVPVQSFEEKGQEERRGQQQPQQQNVYFNGESESSKSALINNLSSSQSVPMSGILPKATVSDMSRSYTRYPQGTTGLFPNFSFLMPLQLSPTNREAKVLRYREKRKARKFEKKIRYASRKAYAEARPRVKGRFARKTDMDFEVDEMFSTEDLDYGIVPSF